MQIPSIKRDSPLNSVFSLRYFLAKWKCKDVIVLKSLGTSAKISRNCKPMVSSPATNHTSGRVANLNLIPK